MYVSVPQNVMLCEESLLRRAGGWYIQRVGERTKGAGEKKKEPLILLAPGLLASVGGRVVMMKGTGERRKKRVGRVGDKHLCNASFVALTMTSH